MFGVTEKPSLEIRVPVRCRPGATMRCQEVTRYPNFPKSAVEISITCDLAHKHAMHALMERLFEDLNHVYNESSQLVWSLESESTSLKT